MRNPPRERVPTQSIGSLAKASSVGIDAIRFYERIGLMPAPKRTVSGYRMYGAGDQQRLEFIRRAQGLGFSLEEIASLLKLSQPGGSVAKARALAATKLEVVEAKLVELERLRQALHSLVKQCSGSGDLAHCPILAALSGETRHG
jgi:MerR family transcriptional regulator, copper efflux regulator